jgi:hypothetical protein
MDADQSILALNTVLRLSPAKPDDSSGRKAELQDLTDDFTSRLASYRKELGCNAYALFNTLTDIAARPPDNPYFQKDRDTIEKRSGRWLKELVRQSQTVGFELDRWIQEWDGSQSTLHRNGHSEHTPAHQGANV